MDLSNDLISKFVKITNDADKQKSKEGTVYGTAVKYDGSIYVKIDGSDLLTPIDTTADIQDGERVTITIKDHNATVTGNITSPSTNEGAVTKKVTEAVDGIEDKVITEVETLVADRVSTKELDAEVARIDELIAGKATIEDLEVTNATIENLKVKDSEIENLVATKATIGDLTATNATIGTLDAKVANIDTLVNGNLTSDNILSFNITSKNTTMEDAFIKDAMIDRITANKIMSGTIDTNNVVIQSTDGSMLLQGTLLQMKDDNGKVRIQIGKDNGGNFTFVLYDETGKGVLIDEEGIKSSDAIADGLIVDAKVADNANISGSKLDIASVITEVNNDNSTTIKSSKIYLNEQNQSLEVAFNSLKSQVETIQDVTIDGNLSSIVEQVQSNTTKIEANKEGINTLVAENVIRTEEISDLEGELQQVNTTLSNKYTSLEQNLDGFKTTVSDTYTTKSEFNNLEVGGRNLVLNSGPMTLENWKKNNTAWSTTLVDCSTSPTGYAIRAVCDTYTNSQGGMYNSGAKAELLVDGEMCTISAWIRASKPCVMAFYFERQKYHSINLSTEWQHYTYTDIYDARKPYRGCIFYVEGGDTEANTWFEVHSLKLEKGNKATDWTPAPEDVQANIDAVDGKFANYSTTTQMNSAINQKANEITSSVSQTYATNYEVKKLADTTTTGLNKFLFERYQNDSFYYNTRPTLDDLVGARLIESKLVDSPPGHTIDLGNKYIGVLTFYLYYDYACTKTVSITTDDMGTVYLNNVSIYELPSGQPANVTFAMSKGLNRIDIIYAENAGTDGVTFGGVGGWSAFGAYANVVTNEIANRTNELTLAMSQGNMIYTDPTFRTGYNGCNVYNNSEGGAVKNERIAAIEGCPNTSGYCLKITTNGTASPDLGGFHFATMCRYNAVFITKITAKIPVGYTINWASNAYGAGGKQKWLSTTSGTGDWHDYYCKVKCGSSGDLSRTNYFYLKGPSASAENPVTWYVSYATVFDVTDSDERLTNLSNNLANNYSTTSQMNSAINQKANEITSSVSSTYTTKTEFQNLEVGSTNLLVGSSDVSKFTDYWVNNGGSILDSYYKGSRIYKVYYAWTDYGFKLSSLSNELATGKKYTYSVYVKSSSSSYLPDIFIYGGGWEARLGTATTSWQRFTIKGTFSHLNNELRIEPTTTSSDSANQYLMVAGMQLEEGEVLTDYSPAPEDVQANIDAVDGKFANYSTTTQMNSAINQKANEITSSVSSTYTTKTEFQNLEVGGRNYLTEAKRLAVQVLTAGTGSTLTVSTNHAECPHGYYLLGAKDGGSSIRIKNVITSNGVWTVSFELRGSQSATVGFNMDICDLGTTRFVTTTDNKWVKHSLTVNVTNYSADVFHFIDLANIPWAYVYIRNIKVEKGGKATDWTPAPEDVQSQIDTINTNLSTSYATKSELTQTNNSIVAKFSESGGYNLIRNSTGASGNTNGWICSGDVTIGVETNDYIGSANRYYFYLDNGTFTTERYAYSSRFKLKPNTTYRFTGYFCNYTKCPSFDVYVLSSTSLSDMDTTTGYTNAHLLISQATATDGWRKFTTTFTTPASTKSGVLRIDNNGYNQSGTNSSRVHWNCLILTEGEMEVPWSPHPSEVYDGITKIDKDGVKVSQSNYNGYTQMKADGFYVNNGSENVISITKDGSYFKGKVVVTSGSTVPTSVLSGTISSSQLNSTITSDISTAKTNASTAVSTANTASTNASTAVSTANTAKSTADTAKSTADSVKSTVDSGKTNWNNAYNRVNEWAYGAVTGSTTIDGGYIQANTITANKIAIGDFNNYCDLRYGYDSGVSWAPLKWNSNGYWNNDPTKDYVQLNRDGRTHAFNDNDSINFTFDFWIDKSITLSMGLWYYDSSMTYLGCNYTSQAVTTLSAWHTISRNLTVSGLPTGTKYVRVLLSLGGTGYNVAIRNIKVFRRNGGELIVDGAITAAKIASRTITADRIASGAITANEIAANAITAAKIAAGAITADKLAANAITSKTITGSTITGGTINGATITSETLMKSYGGVYVGSELWGGFKKDSNGNYSSAQTFTIHGSTALQIDGNPTRISSVNGEVKIGDASSYDNLRARCLYAQEIVYTDDIRSRTTGNALLMENISMRATNAYVQFTSGLGVVRVKERNHLYLQTGGNTGGDTSAEIRCTRYTDASNYVNIRAHNVCAQNAVFAAGVNVSSDRARKRDIELYSTDALHEVCTTPVYAYHLDTDKDEELKRIGIIMQEAPLDAIDLTGKGVDLYQMVTMLWKATQQQQEMIEDLKRQLKGE